MQYVLASTPRYWWPIKVRIPDPENAGKILEQEFEVLFEPQSRDDSLAAQEVFDKLRTNRERADHEHTQLFLVCKDWRGVLDDDQKPVPFNADTFGAALQQSWVRSALNLGYHQSMTGEAARLGN